MHISSSNVPSHHMGQNRVFPKLHRPDSIRDMYIFKRKHTYVRKTLPFANVFHILSGLYNLGKIYNVMTLKPFNH